jgi:DNA (cytosine-5)-methyltransferase 1
MSLQLNLDVHSELIIDNFAGGGGASTGIEIALGRRVDIAINHDREAVAMHTANHPETRHYCESVWEVNPREITQGRPVGLVWLSPDCKHFSKAKGGKPVEKKIRGLAWVAVRWAAVAKPRVIMLENVEEFVTWGPLAKDGRPCPKNKGREFGAFVNALRRLGYAVEWRELRACDYGAPTIRKRLFLIARRDGQPIVWPAPTHGDPKSEAVKHKRLKPWRTAAECIDWSLPTPSIFERARPLADATCRRIAKGIMRYVVEAAQPFIVNTRNGERAGQLPRTRSVTDPFWTVTAQGSQHALVAPVLTEHANASSPRCMPADEPLRTICASTKGGHHALVAAFMAKHYGGVVGHGLHGEPMHTVTSTDHNSLVTSNLIKMRGDNVGQATDDPLQTTSAQGTHFAEVRAFLVKYYGTDQDPRLDEPLHTVTTKDRYGLVTVDGEQYEISDIGMRMLAPRELYRAQGFPEHYIIGDDPAQGLTLTKTAQVRMCGNSVCPPLSAALVRANLGEMAIRRAA